MYYVTLKMEQSSRLSGPLKDMLQSDRRYTIENDQSPALIVCGSLEAASGLISAVSHADLRIHAIEMTQNRPHDLLVAAAGND